MAELTPEEIEREIAAERNALERSIDELQSQFSPDALVEQASDYMKANGGDIAHSIGKAVKDNPIPLAVTGIGLAWLAASVAREDRPKATYDPRKRPTAQGFATDEPPMEGFDDRLERADAAMRRSEVQQAHGRVDDDEDQTGGQTMSDTMQENWESTKSQAQDLKDRAYNSAADLRKRIDEGTDKLPELARDRVRRARSAAIAAQADIERRAGEVAARARQTSQDNPLLMGALVFAAGAALAASLPRTSTENRMIGAQRDRLFDEADRIYEEETSKLKSVAGAAVDEGKAVLKDALSSDSPKVDAGSAVSRVSNAAKTAARS